MDLFERYGPDEGLQRARRFGGRELRSLMGEAGPKRLGEVDRVVGQDVDPNRFRGLYRDRLKEALQMDRQVTPLLQRDALRRQGGSAAQEQLRGLPRFGSAAERFDPRSFGSAALRKFGSLYRNLGS